MKYILFGAGNESIAAYNVLGKENIECFVDNNSFKVGKLKYDKLIISFDELLKIAEKYCIVISVTDQYSFKIAEQLEDSNIYNYLFLNEIYEDELINKIEKSNDISWCDDLKIKHTSRIKDMYKKLYRDEKEQLRSIIRNLDVYDMKPAKGLLRKMQMDCLKFAKEVFDKANIPPILGYGSLIGAIRHRGFIPWDDDLDFILPRHQYTEFIDYCKKNFHVFKIPVDVENEDIWMNNIFKKFPNEEILFICKGHIQLNIGTSEVNRVAFDIFVLDTYKNDYSEKEHLEFLGNKMHYLYHNCDGKTLQETIEEMMKIDMKNWDKDGDKFYEGLDNVAVIPRKPTFLKRDELYPLRKIKFENEELYIFNNYDRILAREFGPNWRMLPPDCGISKHIESRISIFTKADILVDCVEDVERFLPLYNYLKKIEVVPIFLVNWYAANYWEPIDCLNEKLLYFEERDYSESDFVIKKEDYNCTFERGNYCEIIINKNDSSDAIIEKFKEKYNILNDKNI